MTANFAALNHQLLQFRSVLLIWQLMSGKTKQNIFSKHALAVFCLSQHKLVVFNSLKSLSQLIETNGSKQVLLTLNVETTSYTTRIHADYCVGHLSSHTWLKLQRKTNSTFSFSSNPCELLCVVLMFQMFLSFWIQH